MLGVIEGGIEEISCTGGTSPFTEGYDPSMRCSLSLYTTSKLETESFHGYTIKETIQKAYNKVKNNKEWLLHWKR